MMSWQKEVAVSDIAESGEYFIANFSDFNGHRSYNYISRGLNGKAIWSCKPGIAIRFPGKQAYDYITSHPIHVALEIPKDADRRWKARQKRFR